MTVREIKKDDVIPMVNIGEKMHNAGSFKKIKYDKNKLFKLVSSSINSDNMIWFVAEDDGEYIGMIGGFISEFYFSDEKCASDFLLYISEEKRGGKAAVKLLNAFEEWAKARGVKEIRVGTSNGVNPEEVKKFYEWRKYDFIGYLLRKEL